MQRQHKKIINLSLYIGFALALGAFFILKNGQEPEANLTDRQTSPNLASSAQTAAAVPAVPENAVSSNAQSLKNKKKKTRPVEPPAEEQLPELLKEAEEALNAADISMRMRGVLLLRNLATAEAVELLAKFLQDSESAVSQEAIDALGDIGFNPELTDRVVEILLAKAADTSFQSRGSALITAAMVGNSEKVFPAIEAILDENNESARKYAVRAMAFVSGAQCVPLLEKVLTASNNADIQRNAYNLLAKIDTQEARDILAHGVYSEIRGQQLNSVWAMSRRNSEYGVQTMAAAAIDKVLSDQSLAIIARSPAAPEVFGQALQSQNLNDNDRINLLGILALNASQSSKDVRNKTAVSIKPLLNSSDPKVQQAAIDALGKVGASDNQAEALAEKFESDSFLVQESALMAYAQYTTPSTYKPLVELWDNENEKIRRTAFFLSEPFLNQSDMEELQKATESKDDFIAKHSKIMIKHLNQQQ
jgi:HEAT repeat protein